MPKTIKYTGTQRRWPELAYTGKQSVWFPGQTEERTDTEAAQLIATGLFTEVFALDDLPLASLVSGAAKTSILNSASAGQDSGWIPITSPIMKINYQLDSGSANTIFAIDVSADGVAPLAVNPQAFTGSYASSSSAEYAYLPFSHPQAKFFRVTVTTGGPISMTIN